MNEPETQIADSVFYKDVIEGLGSYPKYLQSRYFYDEKGDQLFQEIMNMPEYYLTNCELEILMERSAEILERVPFSQTPYCIIELGAGDGTKTKHLLKEAYNQNPDVEYIPIDISPNVLSTLKENVRQITPIKVSPVNALFRIGLQEAIAIAGERPCLILFLGSNIGNMKLQDARHFLRDIRGFSRKQDMLMVGVDLKKEPKVILDAYNDAAGITARFNLNLLERINRELEGNFQLEKFRHYPLYNPQTGEALSYLISKEKQTVRLMGNIEISFKKNETIFMEVSKKYFLEEFSEELVTSGWKYFTKLRDKRKYFADILAVPI